MHKLLSLEDLYSFYEKQNKTISFDSSSDDHSIVVQTAGKIVFEDSNADDGLMPVTLQACHTDRNLNHTFISEETMEKALPSFANRPILAHIHEIDGEQVFGSHEVEVDDDGNIEYIEKPVGVIPESNNIHLAYDDDKKKTYVVVDGYIYEEYSKAAEILRRETQCAVSVELFVDKLSYDAKTKILNIEDFIFSGVTILGKYDDGSEVKPGMEGANIQIADFDEKNNSLIKEGGNVKLKNEASITINGKKYAISMNEKIAALIDLVNATYSDEDNTYYDVVVYDEYLVMRPCFYDDGACYRQNYAETSEGVYELTGERVEVHVEYLTDEEQAVIDNDREEMKARAEKAEQDLKETEEQLSKAQGELDETKNNLGEMEEKYNASVEELNKYHEEPKKMEILNSKDYELVFDSDEFQKLYKDHFDMSIEDVTAKANEILLNAAKKHNFALKKPEDKRTVKPFQKVSKKTKIYGSLFDDIKD